MASGIQGCLKVRSKSSARSTASDVPLDDAIRNALPAGTIFKSIHRHGESSWSLTCKVETEDENGTPVAYFAKYVAGDAAKRQLEGEFTGMKELYTLAPGLVIKPIAWGPLKSVTPASHFFLLEFRNLTTGLSSPSKLGARLAEMHRKSKSPSGMFGFGVQTYDGARLQSTAWDPSWTSFFSKLLAEAYRQDTETNGVWPEMARVFQRVQTHLVPRLVGAVEEHGIEPCLIHGDLWDGNVATDTETGDPVIFDCGVYYAHNEMEVAIWRAERHELRAEVFRRECFRKFPPSKPQDEWEDRNRLYSAKTNFMHSACYAGSAARQLAFNDFVFLFQKYVPWEEDDSAEWDHMFGGQGTRIMSSDL